LFQWRPLVIKRKALLLHVDNACSESVEVLHKLHPEMYKLKVEFNNNKKKTSLAQILIKATASVLTEAVGAALALA